MSINLRRNGIKFPGIALAICAIVGAAFIGLDRAESQSPQIPIGGEGCEVGDCMILANMNAGCRGTECCDGSTVYCAGFSQSTNQVAEYKFATTKGNCMSQGGDLVPWCTYYPCAGAPLCSAENCGILNEPNTLPVISWVSHGPCGGVYE